jgi:hypothetical protein
MQQVRFDLLGRKSRRVGVAVVARESGNGFGVALNGARRQTAHGHGIDHALTQWVHGFAPEVPGKIPQPSDCK